MRWSVSNIITDFHFLPVIWFFNSKILYLESRSPQKFLWAKRAGIYGSKEAQPFFYLLLKLSICWAKIKLKWRQKSRRYITIDTFITFHFKLKIDESVNLGDRCKNVVIFLVDLPEKLEFVILVKLTPMQIPYYRSFTRISGNSSEEG